MLASTFDAVWALPEFQAWLFAFRMARIHEEMREMEMLWDD